MCDDMTNKTETEDHRIKKVDYWKENLTQSLMALKKINSSTEDDFLSIGMSLSDIVNQSSGLSELATSVVSLFKGKEIDQTIDSLKSILKQCNTYFMTYTEQLGGYLQILKEIQTNLIGVERPLSGFKKIIKHLRMLAIATKIESTRLVDGMNNFHTIADDIDKLSVVITDRSSHILSEITVLKDVMNRTAVILHSIDTAREKNQKDIFERIMAGLTSLSEKYQLSSDIATNISERSGKITQSISTVVSSLQFHDITRQQIEHVIESLKQVTQQLLSTNGHSSIPEILADIPIADICNLESEQLANAKNELCTAVAAVLANLQEITRHIAQNLTDIMKVTGIDAIRNNSFATEMKKTILATVDSFSEMLQANSTLESAIKKVVSTIQDLSTYLKDIEGIGEEIELIALNTCIKAAHTGSDGAALGVLADEVRTLSESAMEVTNVISNGLNNIVHTSETITGTEGINGKTVMDEILYIFDSLVISLNEIQDSVYPILHKIEKGMNHLVTTINNITSSITVHKRVDETLRDVMSMLKVISEDARLETPHLSPEQKERQLRDIAERYTMHKERKIHYRSIVGEVLPSKDLGENVELF